MTHEILRRHVEEFFGYKLVACHIPADSDEIADAFAEDFDLPELRPPFKRFLDQCAQLDTLHGLAFIIDAYGVQEESLNVEGADIFVHFYQDRTLIGEQVTDDASEIRLLPHILLGEVEEVLSRDRGGYFSVPCYYTYLNAEDIRQNLATLVKRTYDGDPGLFGMGRDKGGPPSGFIVAMKEGINL